MTDRTSPEYIQRLFDRFDINGDGAITIEEFKAGLDAGGIEYTDQEIYRFMRKVDLDGDGEIDFHEFSKFWREKMRKQERLERERQQQQQQQQQLFSSQGKFPSVKELRRQFAELDEDDNGYISISELKRALVRLKGHCTDEEVYFLMREADEDGDGRITFDEFIVMMAKASGN